MDGLLLVDKPVDWSSFDVVAKVKAILRSGSEKPPKVGHTGTLDPKASGLLILVIGSYTKKAGEYSKLHKTYEVEMMLGATSSTGDSEGKITKTSIHQPKNSEIVDVLNRFSGDSLQTPPIYSAIKINGQRAYKLAREGKSPELQARSIHVSGFELESYKYPIVNFKASVSSGTYIRSLVEDIGKAFNTGAYTKTLRRLSVGKFSLDSAINIEQLTFQAISRNLILG